MKRLLFVILFLFLSNTALAMNPDNVDLENIEVNCETHYCYITGKVVNNSDENIQFVELQVTIYQDSIGKGETCTDDTYPLSGIDSALAANSEQEFKTRALEKSFDDDPDEVKIKLMWEDKDCNSYSKTYSVSP